MEAMREQSPLAQHSLETGCELDLGDCKGMSQVQGSIHVRVGEVSEPLGEFLFDFRWRETLCLLQSRSIDFEHTFLFPSCLVFCLESFQGISLARLECP